MTPRSPWPAWLFLVILYSHYVAAWPSPVWPFSSHQPDCSNLVQPCEDEFHDLVLSTMAGNYTLKSKNMTITMLLQANQRMRADPKHWECGPRNGPPAGYNHPGIMAREDSRPETTSSTSAGPTGTATSSGTGTPSVISTSNSTSGHPPSATQTSDGCADLETCRRKITAVKNGHAAQEITMAEQEEAYWVVWNTWNQCSPITPTESLHRRGQKKSVKMVQKWNTQASMCKIHLKAAREFKDDQETRFERMKKNEAAMGPRKRDNITATPTVQMHQQAHEDTHSMSKRWSDDVRQVDGILRACQTDLAGAWTAARRVSEDMNGKWKDFGSARAKDPPLFPKFPDANLKKDDPPRDSPARPVSLNGERNVVEPEDAQSSTHYEVEERGVEKRNDWDEQIQMYQASVNSFAEEAIELKNQLRITAHEKDGFAYDNSVCQFDLLTWKKAHPEDPRASHTPGATPNTKLENEELRKGLLDKCETSLKEVRADKERLQKDLDQCRSAPSSSTSKAPDKKDTPQSQSAETPSSSTSKAPDKKESAQPAGTSSPSSGKPSDKTDASKPSKT